MSTREEEAAESYVTSDISFGGLEYALSGNIHKEMVQSFLAGAKWATENELNEYQIASKKLTETLDDIRILIKNLDERSK